MVKKRGARRRWKTPSSATWKTRRRKAGPPSRRRQAQAVPAEAGAAAESDHGPGRHQLLVQPPADAELQLPRAAGTEPRPDPPDDGRPGQRDPDDHHGLRHHPGRGAPEIRRAGPRPDDPQPRLPDQHRRLEPVLHRAAAGRRLRGTRPADAVGGAQHGHRDPPRLRPRRGAQLRAARRKAAKPVRDRRLDRRRHAAARRDDPGLRAGHAPPLAARTSPGIASAVSNSAWAATGPRHDRAALPLQPRRQEPGGDGAGGDPAALCS